LKEVKVDYTKMSALEMVLHRMKVLFDESQDLKDATVSHRMSVFYARVGADIMRIYRFKRLRKL
jgi:hypothetical protein